MGTIRWTTLGASFACLLAANADAALMFAGGNAVAGEGLVSPRQGEIGVTVETFGAGACSIGGPVEVFGDYQIGTGSIPNRRLAPTGDTGCYIATSGNQLVSTLVFSFLNIAGPIDYLGFYWGSIDPERASLGIADSNSIRLFSRLGEPINVVPSDGTTEVSGDTFLALSGVAPWESAYVNFRFADVEDFGFLQISTTNYAFELDHLTWGTNIFAGIVVDAPNQQQVPAPAALILFSAGIAALAGRHRRG